MKQSTNPDLREWVEHEHTVAAGLLDVLQIPENESEFIVSVQQVRAMYVIATVLAAIQHDIHEITAVLKRKERGK